MNDELSFEEIKAMQPDPHPRRRDDERGWIQKNWLSVVMMASWMFTLIWNGGTWLGGTTASTAELQRQVAQLRHDVDESRGTYVRNDVFQVTLESIEKRLASIDRKLSEK